MLNLLLPAVSQTTECNSLDLLTLISKFNLNHNATLRTRDEEYAGCIIGWWNADKPAVRTMEQVIGGSFFTPASEHSSTIRSADAKLLPTLLYVIAHFCVDFVTIMALYFVLLCYLRRTMVCNIRDCTKADCMSRLLASRLGS